MKHKSSKPKILVNHPIGGFLGSLFSVLAIFLILPLFLENYYAYLGLQFCFIVLILSILRSINREKRTFFISLLIIGPFIILDVFSILKGSLLLMVLAYGFFAIFLFYIIIGLFRRVLSEPIIDTNIIFGTITIYLLSGIFWSKLYFVTDYFFPNSFSSIVSLSGSSFPLHEAFQVQFDLFYFSFTTLATVGLGDIAPISNMAKSLTILEAMYGQLFVATVIAKTVSVWRHQRRSADHKDNEVHSLEKK